MPNKIQHDGGWFHDPVRAALYYIRPGVYTEEEFDDLAKSPHNRLSIHELNSLVGFVKQNLPHLLAFVGDDPSELKIIIEELFKQQNRMLDIIQILSSGEPLKK